MAGRGPLLCWSLLDRPPPRPLPAPLPLRPSPREFPRPPPLPSKWRPDDDSLLLSGVWLLEGALGSALAGGGRKVLAVAMVAIFCEGSSGFMIHDHEMRVGAITGALNWPGRRPKSLFSCPTASYFERHDNIIAVIRSFEIELVQ